MSRRTEMLGSTIQRELATIIMRELSDPRLTGLPSITRVKVSDDLSIADVYMTIMGTPGQQTAALNALKHSAGLMRTKLTKQLTVRIAPFLKFHIDEALKKELQMMELLEKVAAETRESDRQKAIARGEIPPGEEIEEAEAEDAAEQTENQPAAVEPQPEANEEEKQNNP